MGGGGVSLCFYVKISSILLLCWGRFSQPFLAHSSQLKMTKLCWPQELGSCPIVSMEGLQIDYTEMTLYLIYYLYLVKVIRSHQLHSLLHKKKQQSAPKLKITEQSCNLCCLLISSHTHHLEAVKKEPDPYWTLRLIVSRWFEGGWGRMLSPSSRH